MRPLRLLWMVSLLVVVGVHDARAEKKTVCSITVNSSDEKEALRRSLPPHTSAEIERSLVRSGYSRADADRLSRALSARHGESSRDRMRLIFKDVPVIYGFSAKAPVGPVAASMLSGYFRSGGSGDIGSGRASGGLRSHFVTSSMAAASGLSDSDPLAAVRRDVCQF